MLKEDIEIITTYLQDCDSRKVHQAWLHILAEIVRYQGIITEGDTND